MDELARELRARGLQVQANPWTGSLLVRYDPHGASEGEIVAAIREGIGGGLPLDEEGARILSVPLAPYRVAVDQRTVQVDREGRRWQRVRLRVAGLHGNHRLAQDLEHLLSTLRSVTVRASVATGRMLVEHDPDVVDLDAILEALSGLPIPEEPLLRYRATVPTDRGPLLYAAGRTVAASAALVFLAVRRMLGRPLPLATSPVPALIADGVTIARGFPAFREGLRRAVGPAAADIVTSSASIFAHTAYGQQHGLVVSFAEGLRLLSALFPWRRAWQRYESMLLRTPVRRPGGEAAVRAPDRLSFDLDAVRGGALVIRPDGTVELCYAPIRLPAGTFVMDGELTGVWGPVTPPRRLLAAPPYPRVLSQYLRLITPLAFASAGLAGAVTRSLRIATQVLVLVNARTALIGAEAADLGAVARALRGGALITALRPGRRLVRPTVVLLDHPALLVDGLQLDRCHILDPSVSVAEATVWASEAAHGTLWRSLFPPADPVAAVRNVQTHYRLVRVTPGKHEDRDGARPADAEAPVVLALERVPSGDVVAVWTFRPRVSADLDPLRRACAQTGARLLVRIPHGTVPAWLRGADVETVVAPDAAQLVHHLRAQGEVVLYVTDHGQTGPACAAAHISVLVAPHRRPLDATADAVVQRLASVAALVEAGHRRDLAVRDSVALSLASNGLAAGLGLRGGPSPALALVSAGSAFLALVAGWMRLRGGEDPTGFGFVDPEPERWARLSPAEVLEHLQSRPEGLSEAEARRRRRALPLDRAEGSWGRALMDQLNSPLLAVLATGALLSFLVGAHLDFVILLGTLLFNVAVGSWQEHSVSRATAHLARLSAPPARVLRDGVERLLAPSELVPGDVILLGFGDRVPADARLLHSESLRVDEAALTGESVPVVKDSRADDERAIVLSGTDVLSGSARAVVVGVGEDTRLGATRQALGDVLPPGDRLAARLAQLTRLSLPVSVAAGALVTVAGIARGAPVVSQVALGASLTVAAVPEGLPLLARLSEAATARRLARRGVLPRRPAAVEALGRVSVLCVDKTGTLTRGQLRVQRLVTAAGTEDVSPLVSDPARRLLAAAALASPSLDRGDALAHSTDAAILEAARALDLPDAGSPARLEELPFDSVRPYHAVRLRDRVVLKGSPEFLLPRCAAMANPSGDPSPDRLETLQETALGLARDGLRVLLVAEGAVETPLEDPRDLVALGLIGIADGLRPQVRDAVRRCHEAGVRVIMITGDHPATAESVARAAGLPVGPGRLLHASELRELDARTLTERLAEVSII
ncbi:MAG: HAD-IC family P-type ATPase, partial [Armatimonadetes bacterium]|nr:HAD-IC family P-type ATPase [Armatimonadota bacterium]MDW8153972.1 HAD-IC family P-type ATPase [Armatimonadota bacterium]